VTKLILTLFLKLSYLTKSILAVALSIFDDLIKFFDDIGLYIFHSVRSIRYEEIREYISENYITIILIFILVILIYPTLLNKNKYE
tara:strand:- start:229 stop:486 length:258 start_codon:yes stop_codon:yes gene_type:complete